MKTIITTLVLITSTFAFAQKSDKMNLKDLHTEKKDVQTNMMFPATDGKVISLQILKNKELESHVTKVPALLVCVEGKAIYEDENGTTVTLLSGDFVKIPANVKHSVKAMKNANLLLIK